MSEHTPDEMLRAQLRAQAPAPPFDDVDWAALHTRTTARAVPLLRRRSLTWWQVLGARSSHVRSAVAAAAIIVLLLTGLLMPERPAPATVESGYHTIEEELALSIPYSSVPLLASDAESGAVIDALLLYDREEW